MAYLNIAIDGPAGAGKSTVAKSVAKQLGITHLDTGAMYRAIGLKILRSGISTTDAQAVVSVLKNTQVDIAFKNGQQRVRLDGEDVTHLIRTPDVSQAASDVSAIAQVRQVLTDMQRQIAASRDVVMDGRDIGTVVLPQSPHKFFITASPEIRAKRRCLELKQKGIETSYEEVLKDQKARDDQDANRAVAPLKPADSAVLIDTTDLSIEEVVTRVLSIIQHENK